MTETVLKTQESRFENHEVHVAAVDGDNQKGASHLRRIAASLSLAMATRDLVGTCKHMNNNNNYNNVKILTDKRLESNHPGIITKAVVN